ncbi:NAD(P)-binding protein [Auriculariales sp. MPI-PUGE-AT-0066]|nr:NAD(P)-binding protein [Auriculariales sp. MPI-PUGE-AT-0066]
MRVLIVGATGPCGILLIQDSLVHGHDVVVYARSPSRLPPDIPANDRVTVIEGQLGDAETLKRALQGVDAVLSALGPPVSVKSPLYPSDTPIAKGYVVLVQAMKDVGCRRLIALGTTSIKDPSDRFSPTFFALVTGVMALATNAYRDVVQCGKIITESGLDWTVARVPVLNDQDDIEYIAGYVGDGHTKPVLTRKAFAKFCLDELEAKVWVQKLPLVTSPRIWPRH